MDSIRKRDRLNCIVPATKKRTQRGRKRKRSLTAQVNSQRQQDELQTRVELVAPAATDEVLVAAAKLRDHHAFMELWTRHSRTAFNVAYRIMRNRDDAEDAIQDAWMKAYKHLDTFDGRAKFSTWARAHCDQFVAYGSSKKTCLP